MGAIDLIVYPPVVLGLVYPIAIQYERGGWYRLLAPLTFAAALLDIALNYTTLAALTLDVPRKKEYTFSMRLARLVNDEGWRGKVARPIALYLDNFDPSGKHVKRG